MLDKSWRLQTWSDLDQPWDIIVIGGGITGAGIFNMAAQKGLRVLLVEAQDFAFGTSSRSSKLVHGGIRYLRNRQYDVVRESVIERERMIKESDGLVEPLPFIFPSFENNLRETRMMKLAVVFYDLMAFKWQHQILNEEKTTRILPALKSDGLVGGVKYMDSRVDDSQLVLRVIMDGIRFGGHAINYAKAVKLCKAKQGKVEGILLRDQTGRLHPSEKEIRAKVVINATGPWSDLVRAELSVKPRLRPLRGSHLIFSQEKIPLNAAVTMLHPRDNRALFAIPWQNRTIIGTTDLDHDLLEDETHISQDETDYLLEAAQHAFPHYPVNESDIISTFAGLRPVINTNAPTPSKESRAHAFWDEEGLVTITGGKLTIFRVMAADVLNFCQTRLPNSPQFDHCDPCFYHPKPKKRENMKDPDWIMMTGRLGLDVHPFFEQANPEDLHPIDPIPEFWAELTWAAKNEAVVHLDDLLLRRVRVGLLFPNGGLEHVTRVRSLVQEPLGWSDETWEKEWMRYQEIWRDHYFLPK